jgi:hypothetical protein
VWLTASDPTTTWAVTGTVVAAVLTLVSGVVTAWFTFHGSSRATDAKRAAAFGAAVDADRMSLREERDELRRQLEHAVRERDDYRERWVRLRLAVIRTGLDPDRLPRQRGRGAQP